MSLSYPHSLHYQYPLIKEVLSTHGVTGYFVATVPLKIHTILRKDQKVINEPDVVFSLDLYLMFKRVGKKAKVK